MKLSHTVSQGPGDKLKQAGASLIEYALLVALIAVVCIGAVTLLGRNSSSTMSSGATATNDAGGATTTTAGLGCADVHPDGYATGAGYGWDCYSPTYGPYDIP